jgi:hypothetical protein
MNAVNISSMGKTVISITLLIAFTALLLPIDYNIYWDQCVYLLHGQYFSGSSIGYSELLFRSPLLSFLTSPIWYITSKIIYFKLISFCFTLSFIYFNYKYVKIISTKNIALVTSLLLATAGILQLESKYFLTDIPALAFMFATLYFIHTNHRYRFLIAGVLFGLTITMRLGYLYFSPIMALYFLANMKNKKTELIESLLGFLMIYSIYNIWIYNEFETVFGNIYAARFEGHWVSSYTFDKIFQILRVTGASVIICSILGIIKENIKDWIWPLIYILVVFIIIPFNPQNDRFIIPAIPFLLYLTVRYLNSIKKKNVFVLITTIVLTEHAFLILKNRAQLSQNSKDQPSIGKKIGLSVNKYKHDTIYTNNFYPSIAYYSKKHIIVPHSVGHEKDEFHFIDHAFLTKPGLVITNGKGSINKRYLKSKNQYFKYLHSVEDFNIYEYLGKFSKEIKQYKLYILEAPGDKYAQGHGFLEMNGNQINKFYMKYMVTDKFLKETGWTDCLDKKALTFKYISDIPISEIDIISKSKDSIWIKFQPKKVNDCQNMQSSFKLRYDLINKT